MKKTKIAVRFVETYGFLLNLLLLFNYFKLYFISKILLYNESYIYNISMDCNVQTRNAQQSLYIGKTNYIMKI